MGSLEDLLDCITSEDMGYLLDAAVDTVPRSKRERAELIKECLASGKLDFLKDVVGITKGQKAWLEDMCVAAGVDPDGTIAVLRGRLETWYSRNLPSGGRGAASAAPRPAPEPAAPNPASQSRSIASVSIAERQFIQVKMKTDGLWSALGSMGRGFGETFLGATKLLTYTPTPTSKATFERGHPVDGSVYVLDPYSESQLHYLLADEAARRIAEQKISALTVIAGCLGATRIEVVAVRTEGRTTENKAEIDVLGKQIGLDVSMSSARSSKDRIGIEWDTSEVRPIPKQYLPYLESMSDLRALADMVYAGRQPSNMQRQVTLDFRECQDISAKVSKLSSIGSLAAKTGRQEFVSSDWTFGIWFTRSATQTSVSGIPAYAPAASSGPQAGSLPRSGGFCSNCGAARAPSARFCAGCGSQLA